MNYVPTTIPSTIENKIVNWFFEFERFYAMERLDYFQKNKSGSWRYICEDINLNTPVYVFNILTQSGKNIQWPINLRNCDPYSVDTRFRIPESHILYFTRRAVTLPNPSALHIKSL